MTKKQYWYAFPEDLALHPESVKSHLHIYGLINCLRNKSTSAKSLCNWSSLSRSTVFKVLKDLVDWGFLMREGDSVCITNRVTEVSELSDSSKSQSEISDSKSHSSDSKSEISDLTLHTDKTLNETYDELSPSNSNNVLKSKEDQDELEKFFNPDSKFYSASNLFMQHGRRPLKNYPDVWLSRFELKDVFDHWLSLGVKKDLFKIGFKNQQAFNSRSAEGFSRELARNASYNGLIGIVANILLQQQRAANENEVSEIRKSNYRNGFNTTTGGR